MRAMTTCVALIALASGLGCSSIGAEESASSMSAIEVAGHYGQAGHIGFLELMPGGQYECFIVNGMTADGCGTFRGAGVSAGTWSYDHGVVTLVPRNESPDLVLSLLGASAVPSERGLALTAQGKEHFLAREGECAEQADPALQTGGPAGLR